MESSLNLRFRPSIYTVSLLHQYWMDRGSQKLDNGGNIFSWKLLKMCGRYVSPDDMAIEREFNLVHQEWTFPPSFNVAPTQDVPVIRVAKDGSIQGKPMKWGLIPYWARGVPPKFSTINATIEKLTEAASWKGPWTRGQRCIMPATGFYEWQLLADGKSKQPHYITLNDQDTFGLAALWDSSKRDDGTRIYSCTIVTMPAN